MNNRFSLHVSTYRFFSRVMGFFLRRSNSSQALGFPDGSVVKHPPANAGDVEAAGLIPGLGRSPGWGNVNPSQYPWLENSMDRGAWWATAHGVTELDMTEYAHMHYILHDAWLNSWMQNSRYRGLNSQMSLCRMLTPLTLMLFKVNCLDLKFYIVLSSNVGIYIICSCGYHLL